MDYFNGFKPYQQPTYLSGLGGNYNNINYQGVGGNFQPKMLSYASEAEINAMMLPANSQVSAFDREKPIIYIKTSDNLGRSVVEKFKYEKITDDNINNTDNKYVTREEFNKFVEECKNIEKLLKVSEGKDGQQ